MAYKNNNSMIQFTKEFVQQLINFIAVSRSGLTFGETAQISNTLYAKLSAEKEDGKDDKHDTKQSK